MLAVRIGSYLLSSPLILAPMAGVTDRAFRQLCRRMGAGLAVSEMLTSQVHLWHSRKSQQRLCQPDEAAPRAVQIAGHDPQALAEAACLSVAQGAQIIDINMGCPAKKVCAKAAGSALMKDEHLVAKILAAVVSAVSVPVTLKIRTGWDAQHRNAPQIAKIAEESGVAAVAIHGRTRADFYQGCAEYDTIALVKQQRSIPILANGDIDSPEKARWVLDNTQADGLLIGRAAQGNPWIFREIAAFLRTGGRLPSVTEFERYSVISEHLSALYGLYGEDLGVRVARKHVGLYLRHDANAKDFLASFNQLSTSETQQARLRQFFCDFLPVNTGTGEEQAVWQ